MSKNKLRHILSVNQLDRALLAYVYLLTNNIRRFDKSRDGLLYLRSLLSHARAMLYFTQSSTRTFLSFQSACHILGLQSCEIRDASTSSEYKGESVEDSLRTFSSYVDLIIMRSPREGLGERMAELLDTTPRSVPIINAGSGLDEHPTQAVLDIYTIMRRFGGVKGVSGKVYVFVGDLKRGRTVKSLVRLLCLFKGVRFLFVAPKEYGVTDALRDFIKSRGVEFSETQDFFGAIEAADVVYMTRMQSEYGASSAGVAAEYVFGKEQLDLLGKDSIIMHPLPRREELSAEVDSDERAVYWRQERNGMWTRAALITILMGVNDRIVLDPL